MRILLSTQTPDIDSPVDERFGRSAYFLVLDTDTLDWQAEENPGVNASGGAGVQAAQYAADQKVDLVISGAFGPNAYQGLDAAGTSMYLYGSCSTARQAVEQFISGKLEKIDAPTAKGK